MSGGREDDRIRALHEQGLRPVAIALALRATPDAVRDRLVALGLRPHGRATTVASPLDVVLARLERPGDGCWLWDGPFHGKYAAITVGGAQVFVAKVLWEHFRAPNPRPLQSTCGEARCVRPEHRQETPAARRRSRPR